MSYKYLALKRIKGAMQLGLTPEAVHEFSASTLTLWLQNTQEHYTLSNTRSVYAPEAKEFLKEYEDQTIKALDGLSKPGRLLIESVLHACKMPVPGELDANLSLIDSAYHNAQKAE